MLKNQRESVRSAGGRKVFLGRLPEFAILAVLLLLFFIFGGRALKHIAIAQIRIQKSGPGRLILVLTVPLLSRGLRSGQTASSNMTTQFLKPKRCTRVLG